MNTIENDIEERLKETAKQEIDNLKDTILDRLKIGQSLTSFLIEVDKDDNEESIIQSLNAELEMILGDELLISYNDYNRLGNIENVLNNIFSDFNEEGKIIKNGRLSDCLENFRKFVKFTNRECMLQIDHFDKMYSSRKKDALEFFKIVMSRSHGKDSMITILIIQNNKIIHDLKEIYGSEVYHYKFRKLSHQELVNEIRDFVFNHNLPGFDEKVIDFFADINSNGHLKRTLEMVKIYSDNYSKFRNRFDQIREINRVINDFPISTVIDRSLSFEHYLILYGISRELKYSQDQHLSLRQSISGYNKAIEEFGFDYGLQLDPINSNEEINSKFFSYLREIKKYDVIELHFNPDRSIQHVKICLQILEREHLENFTKIKLQSFESVNPEKNFN